MSVLGFVLVGVYLAIAIFVVQDDLRSRGGNWIRLRGMMTGIVTLPSQITLGWLLRHGGVRKVDFTQPGWLGHAEIVAHVLVTAAAVYWLGWVIGVWIG
jgi:hypothetical protein